MPFFTREAGRVLEGFDLGADNERLAEQWKDLLDLGGPLCAIFLKYVTNLDKIYIEYEGMVQE